MAKLYVGDSQGAPAIVKIKEVPKEKIGVTVDTFIGDVNENGRYIRVSEPTFIDGDNITTVDDHAFHYRFAYCNITGGSFKNIVVDSGVSSFLGAFHGATISGPIVFGLQEITYDNYYYFNEICRSAIFTDGGIIQFPNLRKINASRIFNSAFYYADNASGFDSIFPALEEIVAGASLFDKAFYGGSFNVITASKLKKIQGPSPSYYYLFVGCDTRIYNFPAAEEVTGNLWASYDYCREIHFAQANKDKIESCSGYDKKWGATNATIYFDL